MSIKKAGTAACFLGLAGFRLNDICTTCFVRYNISLFNGTIEYNIAYGDPDASFEAVQNAAKNGSIT
ncbi:MAG: hypothetical protein WCP96_17785 [Methylococcaceae bacterium]